MRVALALVHARRVRKGEVAAPLLPDLRVEMAVVIVQIFHRRRLQGGCEQNDPFGIIPEERALVLRKFCGFPLVISPRAPDARLRVQKLRDLLVGLCLGVF